MSASTMTGLPSHADNSEKRNRARDNAPDVVVYIEAERDATALIGQAKSVALAFGANVLLVSVIEPPEAGISAVDPVGWDIRRREASRHLADFAKVFRSENCDISVKVLEGHPTEQICHLFAKKTNDIIALPRELGAGRWAVGAAACGAMASDVGAILAIPTDNPGDAAQGYGKVFVPLDGSANAESAIPTAARLAKAHGAELLLCHVTPEPVLTEVGPADPETVELKTRVARHNKRVGLSYLKRVKAGLKDGDVPVSTRLLADGDARRSIIKAIAQESADVVVMASHGRSGHTDVPAGDIAGFILDRSPVPVLVTRQPQARKGQHIIQSVRFEDLRHPVDLAQ